MENKNIYVVIGGLWKDKENGNTYHAAKIINPATGHTFFTEYTYGYETAYLATARAFIREVLKIEDFTIINGGAFWITKKAIKNGTF